MTIRAAVLIFFIPAVLHADALGDIRAALTRMTGRQPIRGTYEVKVVRESKGRFANTNFRGGVAVELDSDTHGVRVTVPRNVLDQIAAEQKAQLANPKAQTPTLGSLDEVGPTDASEVLDMGPALLSMLDGAKLLSDGRGTWQGKPVRVVVLKLTPRPSANGEIRMGKVTESENRMTLWLADDAVPLAAERTLSMKASFLILRGEFKEKRSWHFARHGDRLVRVRYEASGTGSGMGQSGTETKVALLRVH
ncbi:MAG TPA: hypothetical protein VF618_10935 [Thermoanaerobaculia bacterium]